MKTWDQEEFKKLCKDAGKNIGKYHYSLAEKLRAARKYHLNNILEKLKQSKINNEAFLENTLRYESEIAIELDAFMGALNSMFDVLAKLMNECLLNTNEKTSTDDVALKGDFLRKLPDQIRDAVNKMKGNHLFNRINSFCNISKHIHVIGGNLTIYHHGTSVSAEYISDEYQYHNNQKQLVSSEDLKELAEFVESSINSIGRLINEEMKNSSKLS